MIRINNWDEMLSYIYIEVRKNPNLPDLSKKDIKRFHMIYWGMVRDAILQERTFKIPSVLKFYLKRKQLKKRYEKQRRKEEKAVLYSESNQRRSDSTE